MIVYKATNLKNNKVYFCVTSRRLNDAISIQKSSSREKKRRMKKKPHLRLSLSPFHKALLKDGAYNFSFCIVGKFKQKEDAYSCKEQCIVEFSAMNPDFGYNCTTGGMTSWKHSSCSVKNMKRACSGTNKGENNPMYGRTGELNPTYGKPKPSWTKEMKRNQVKILAKRKVMLVKKYKNMTEKRCSKCKEIKKVDMFHKNRENLSNLDSQCKPCKLMTNKNSLKKRKKQMEKRR